MSKKTKKFSPKLKKYLLLISGCFLFILFILKLNSQNKQEIFPKRNLEGEAQTEENEKKSKICSKTSDNVKQYYKTGDKTLLGIDDDNIKREDNERINDLIKVVKIQFSENKDKKNDFKNLIEYFKTYGKHILPLIIILIIAILSLPGYIVCISLCCGDCCCCCCCVQKSCKIPSFVFSYIFYGIVAIVCFYGLGKSNSIFLGIADTECSILKFVDDFVEGESRTNPPYWAGIDKISEILEKLSLKINELKSTSIETDLSTDQNNFKNNKNTFEGLLKSKSEAINTKCTTDSSCKDYFVLINSNEYQLDIAKKFGTFDVTDNPKENSICDLWINEYKSSSNNANVCFEETLTSFFGTTTSDFHGILGDDSVQSGFTDSKTRLTEIKKSFKTIKETIAGNIVKKADNLDKNGRLAFKLIYSFLIIMDAGIATLMLLLCFCSGKICTCCSCTRCFCKFFIHILWNFMALFMICLFLIGSLFTLFGKIGEDMMSVFAYLVSEENLSPESDTILLGDVKQYLNKCFNYDGDISSELGLTSDMKTAFENIKSNELKLEEIKNEFNDKMHAFVYNEYLSEVNKRISYSSSELSLEATDTTTDPSSYKFQELLDDLNEEGISVKEKWLISSTSNEICNEETSEASSHDDQKEYHPSKCYPTNKYWVQQNNDLKAPLQAIKDLMEIAETNTAIGMKNIMETLGQEYKGNSGFLQKEIVIIQEFITTIKKITDIVKIYSGEEEEMFTFINCKFIKSDMQVLIANLKKALGETMYTVGIYLLVAAFSLAFAISFTILLTIIINKEVEKNKKEMNETQANDVPEMPVQPVSSEEAYLKQHK